MSVSTKSLRCGLIAAVLSALLLSAVTGLAALFFDIPDSAFDILSTVIVGAASYCAAYRSTQINRSKGIKQGILCGLSLYLLIFLLSLIFSQCGFTELAAIKAAVCLFFGIVGGIIGINTKKTKR